MKIALFDMNGVNMDLLHYFEVVNNIKEAERLVLWQDLVGDAPKMITEAHSLNIPCIVTMHGPLSGRDYFPPVNAIPIADKYLCWGQAEYDLMVKRIEKERLVVTGNSSLSHLEGKIPHAGKKVLFVPYHYSSDIKQNWAISNELAKGDWFLQTKIIDGHTRDKYTNPIYSFRVGENHMDVWRQILPTTDVMVTNYISTPVFFALHCDVPVVWVDYTENILPDEIGSYLIDEYKLPVVTTSFDKMNETVRSILDSDTLKDERKKAADYFTSNFIDAPIVRMVEEIKGAVIWQGLS